MVLPQGITGLVYSHRYGGIPGRRRLEPYSICNALVDVLAARTDAIIQADSDVGHFCIACDGGADMLHVAGESQVYGTCQHCRDTKSDSHRQDFLMVNRH